MTSANPAAILQIAGLHKQFGDLAAVRGVSETFARGEYFCILGPSGCGKTTLLRLVAGFEEPTAGEIILNGQRLNGVLPERRNVNVVFQNYALFPHMTVRENVAFGLRMKKEPAHVIRARTEEALRLVRLEEQAERYPRQLSGGQQQRVALARALVNRPQVLLLDEPLSALDKSLRLAMQEELRRIQRETGVTFLHVTHDQAEALSMADRVAVMRAGRFVQVGTPHEVYHRPANRFVAEFLGAANLLDGVVEGGCIRIGDGLHLQTTSLPGTLPERTRLTLAVRPEAIQLCRAEENGGPNLLIGRLRRATFAGPTIECLVEVGPLSLSVHLPTRRDAAPLAEGETVTLRIRPEDVIVLPPDDGPEPADHRSTP
jgi:spermidine/putrescine transport system ATP-binding protein